MINSDATKTDRIIGIIDEPICNTLIVLPLNLNARSFNRKEFFGDCNLSHFVLLNPDGIIAFLWQKWIVSANNRLLSRKTGKEHDHR